MGRQACQFGSTGCTKCREKIDKVTGQKISDLRTAAIGVAVGLYYPVGYGVGLLDHRIRRKKPHPTNLTINLSHLTRVGLVSLQSIREATSTSLNKFFIHGFWSAMLVRAMSGLAAAVRMIGVSR